MVLGLILLSGVFAGAEIAIVSLRRSQLMELVQNRRAGSLALSQLRDRPEQFLATVQVGITVIGVTAAAFGGERLAGRLALMLEPVPLLGAFAGEIALPLVVVAISFLSLVLGELVPKSLALRYSSSYGLLMGGPLLQLSRVSRPFVWLLTTSSNLVLKVFGDSTNFTEARVSPDEIRHMVDEAERSGSVNPGAGEILSRAIDFGSLRAADVMVHRRFVIGVPVDADTDRVKSLMLEHKHRRLPIYEKTIDRVVGYLSWRDVMAKVFNSEPVVVRDLMRPVHLVPEGMPALTLLQQMQERRAHMAIALEEHGGMAGIVTLEDLVEELVGDIFSEHDPVEADPIRRLEDGSAIVPGRLTIRDVNRVLDASLPEEGDWYTLGGLCTYLAEGRMPQKGEKFGLPDGTRLEIADASPRRVRSVRIHPVSQQGQGEQGS